MTKTGKAIVLFSDGTGNSSGKLHKTNVWRMYEAIELGPDALAPEQIIYYDEGVGNSWIRPFAALGAIFGIGLKRNVLDLYRFLCRNYSAVDEDCIYAFGFSRGAFTIRMLVGLIDKEGLIPYEGEADLVRRSKDAFRCYLKGRNPRFLPMRLIVPAGRWLVAQLIAGKRALFKQRMYDCGARLKPKVSFVGVWDTVAAYGGPVTEIVRGFDDWIRPLTFTNRSLPAVVERARHALALDDERDAFHPLPWDEPANVDRDRLQQVWFSGMHADVGGGYPDDGLAYVSLTWMMEESQKAGLVLRPDKVAQAGLAANAFAPLHDSRSGLGSYYRYQPRNVGAYLQPPTEGTESQRDPETADQGIDHCPWVHESVLCRIHAGTDGYAPTTLPGRIKVVGSSKPRNNLPANLQKAVDDSAGDRDERQENIRDAVWWRRVAYFAIVALTAVLAALPLLFGRWTDPLCGDARCWPSTALSGLGALLPGFAKPWVNAFSHFTGITLTLVALIFVLRAVGTGLERGMRDRMRDAWRDVLAGVKLEAVPPTLVRRVRTHRLYQGSIRLLKWGVLPTISGISMLLILVWAAWVIVGQLRLAAGETGSLFCGSREVARTGNVFQTSAPCSRLGVEAVQNASYRITIRPTRDWKDGRKPASPQGIGAWELSTAGILGAPFRRVALASYMQPVIEIRAPSKFVDRYANIWVAAPAFTQIAPDVYQAEFTSKLDGAMSIYVNDAVVPLFPSDYFYRGPAFAANTGAACVEISYAGKPLTPSCTPASNEGLAATNVAR